MNSSAWQPARTFVPVLLGVAFGIHVLLAGLVLIGPAGPFPGRLTLNGDHNLRPEHDGPVYLAAGLISVAAAVLLTRIPALRRRSARRPLFGWLSVPVAAATIVTATGAFLLVRDDLPVTSLGRYTYLAFSLLLGLVCVLVAGLARPPGVDTTRRPPPSLRRDPARVRLGVVDVVVALLVSALLYLPGWRQLAGNAFAAEGALHLDFFAFGPALVFRAGAALGTELHSYYGLGWPVVFARLDPLSYGHIIRLEVLYGCAYFCGVYVLLRVLVGDRRWAAAGTVLAILFQLFAGFPSFLVMWRFPSATVMRWPFDIWVFLLCARYLRTRRPAWMIGAAALVALALVFETDTGLALAAAFAFLWICVWRAEGSQGLGLLASSAAVATAVLVVGLGVASRWTLLSGAFWAGWLENLRLSAGGATLLPLTTEPPWGSIITFVGITSGYLAVVGYSTVHLVMRRLSATSVMLGSIGLYGFLTLLYFVGRSSPHNLFRPTVPFAILLAACGGLAHRGWARRRHGGGARATLAAAAPAWAALAVAVAMLVAHPGARAYPGLLRSALYGGEERRACLFEDPDDVCGLLPAARQTVDDLEALASRLRVLGSARASVAVLDEIGPLIAQMAGARPWGRYQPMFPGLFTYDQVAAVGRDLREDPPELVVMRPRAEDRPFYADIWRELRVPVEDGFELDSSQGPFEIWKRR